MKQSQVPQVRLRVSVGDLPITAAFIDTTHSLAIEYRIHPHRYLSHGIIAIVEIIVVEFLPISSPFHNHLRIYHRIHLPIHNSFRSPHKENQDIREEEEDP